MNSRWLPFIGLVLFAYVLTIMVLAWGAGG